MVSGYPTIPVLNTTSPARDRGYPKENPVKTEPSSNIKRAGVGLAFRFFIDGLHIPKNSGKFKGCPLGFKTGNANLFRLSFRVQKNSNYRENCVKSYFRAMNWIFLPQFPKFG